MRDNDSGWRIDRHVPIALIFALAVHAGAFLIWSATIDTRVGQLERQAISPERIARLETKVDVLIAQLAEIQILVRQRGR